MVNINSETDKVQNELSNISSFGGTIDNTIKRKKKLLDEKKKNKETQSSENKDQQLHEVGKREEKRWKCIEDDKDTKPPNIIKYKPYYPIVGKKEIKHITITKFSIMDFKGWHFTDVFEYFAYLYYKKKYHLKKDTKLQIIIGIESKENVTNKIMGSSFYTTMLLNPDKINYTYMKHKLDAENYSNPETHGTVSFAIREVNTPKGKGRTNQRSSAYKIEPPWDTYCGQACLVRFIYRECYEFKEEWKLRTGKKFAMVKNKKDDRWSEKKKTWLDNAKILSDIINHRHEEMTIHDFNKFVDVFPEVRVVILDEDKNIIFKTKMAKKTCVLYLNNSHYSLITEILSFLRADKTNKSYKSCDYCFKLYLPKREHKCIDKEYCYYCGYNFKNFDDGAAHMDPEPSRCQYCNKKLQYKDCKRIHEAICTQDTWYCSDCNKKCDKENHQCGEYKCFPCNIIVPPNTYHRCYLKPLKTAKRGKVDNYAFDIECAYDPKTCKHNFTMIVIKKLYTNEEYIFHDIKDFHTFIENINKSKRISHLWAHNAKGYDSFILFNIFYNEFNITPTEIIRNGKKIMMMKYGMTKFLDSMNHISGSLNNLIPTFGLNIKEKGYFPYRFYTTVNKSYIGHIPDKKFFNCARCSECCSYDKCSSDKERVLAGKKMYLVSGGTSILDMEVMTKEQKEKAKEINEDYIYKVRSGETCKCKHFHEWYESEKKYEYDIKIECEEYCRNDVDILTKALESYRDLALEITGVDPLNKITIASYAYEYFRFKHLKSDSIGLLNRKEYEFARASLQGGRTNALGFYYKGPMRYIDVVSLYPSVQRRCEYPVGHPVIDEEPELKSTIELIKSETGFVRCKIIPPNNLYHPLLLVKKGGKLVESLLEEDFEDVIYTMVELRKALELKYKIVEVYETHIYKSQKGLFTSYIDKLFELKNKFSQEGNQGKKAITKLLLNSLWGKFGQKDINKKEEYVELKKFLNMAKKFNIIDFEELSNDKVFVQYNEDETENLHLNNSNPAIASYTTSHARLVLYEAMEKLGTRVLYHDTDSLIYKGEQVIPEGKGIGEWELETEVDEFVSIGAKSYAYKHNETTVVKSKGFNSEWIKFDDYKEIVDSYKNPKKIRKKLYLNDFHMKRTKDGITNIGLIKKLDWVYDKRQITDDMTITYPFGYKKN